MSNDSHQDSNPEETLQIFFHQIQAELAEDGFIWTEVRSGIRQLFQHLINALYVQPLLQQLMDRGIENSNQHADRIAMNRSSTKNWWDLVVEGRSRSLPSLEAFIRTLLAFHIEPSVLPSGKEVCQTAWRACLTYTKQLINGEIDGNENDRVQAILTCLKTPQPETSHLIEELVCIGVGMTHIEKWQRMTLENNQQELQHLADLIRCGIEIHLDIEHTQHIREVEDIQEVIFSWFEPYVIVFNSIRQDWNLI